VKCDFCDFLKCGFLEMSRPITYELRGGGMSVCCTDGPIVRYTTARRRLLLLYYGYTAGNGCSTISLLAGAIAICHFGSIVKRFWSRVVQAALYSKYRDLYLYLCLYLRGLGMIKRNFRRITLTVVTVHDFKILYNS